ncbi:MAG: hypothetical protein ACXVLQ_14010 [Bacteriovorax sp.]
MKFKRLFPLVSLLLINQAIYAEDCEDMKDGEIVRIDQKGGSLENFHVQDQDGLGTCYANTASLLLQASLKNHPEVSYLQLAAIAKTEPIENLHKYASKPEDFELYAKKIRKKNAATNGNASTDQWILGLDIGSVCGPIDAAKAEQKKKGATLCPRKQMNLEEVVANGDPKMSQFKSILESSKYMNLFQEQFKDLAGQPTNVSNEKMMAAQKKYEDFKSAFSGLVAEKKKSMSEKECTKLTTMGMDGVLQPAIQEALNFYGCFTSETNTSYFCKLNRALVSGVEKKGDYAIESKGMSPQFLKKLRSKITDPKKIFSVDQMKKDLMDSLLSSVNLEKNEKQPANDFAARLINKIPMDKLENLVSEFNEIKANGYSETCVERSVVEYLSGKKFEDDWKRDAVLCEKSDLMEQASQVIVEYERSGLKGIDNALDFVLDKARLKYDEALMSLYAVDCKDKDKITIPEDLNCSSAAVTPELKDDVDKRIFSSLKGDRPISAFVCASIFDKPKSSFAEGECNAHHVAVTGLKCVDGKYKYLMQNSWGKNYRPKNPALQIEEGQGAYWFDEKSFYDSVQQTSSLIQGK